MFAKFTLLFYNQILGVMVSTTLLKFYRRIMLTDRLDIPNSIGITGTPTIDPTVSFFCLARGLKLFRAHYPLSSALDLQSHEVPH